MFFAAQLIGAAGLLRFKVWGYAMYALLTLGMTIGCVIGFVMTQQLASDGGPPLIQFPTMFFMLLAMFLSLKHSLHDR